MPWFWETAASGMGMMGYLRWFYFIMSVETPQQTVIAKGADLG